MGPKVTRGNTSKYGYLSSYTVYNVLWKESFKNIKYTKKNNIRIPVYVWKQLYTEFMQHLQWKKWFTNFI